MSYMRKIGEITLIHRGKECDVEWKMDFSSLSKRNGAGYLSPDFTFDGDTWNLGMYLKGSKYRKSDGFIHVRLFRESSNDPPITVEFTFSIKAANGQKVLQRRRTEDFKFGSYHDIEQFMSTSDFEKRQSEFLVSGSLTLVCTLKIITSTEISCEIATAECLYCKGTFDAEIISSHQKKCRVKCPECSDVVLYQTWNDHKCEMSRAEDDRPVCDDFKKVLLNGLNYDLTLKVGDKELRAHQDILRARSQVFESMLSHDTQEKKSGVINIPDCDAEAMELFLYYIYTGKVDSSEESTMLKLYYIADKYDMKGLKGKCSSFIKKSISSTIFCEVIQLALNHSDSSLLEHATEYFIDNMLEIMRTVEWQVFMKENSTVANELTIKSVEKLKNVKL